ncbi:autotransporter adhesin [Burkholderia cenocepacia]|uniref:YadA-like family protein n=1 Tax=Burkholderia cenocepacia TaxID=95486 RepID=UPI000F59880E|nr:YadA-like family protein [Burkholderia cenocepacia]RQU38424.1 autotransporter adhesin [Burkholderia cenocepacia]
MNKIYKTIWNETIRAWIAVHEHAAVCGKPARSARRQVSRGLLALGVAATGFAVTGPDALAQTVVSGGANNAPSGKTATVDQSCGQNFVDRKNPGNTSSGGGTYVLTNGCSTAVGNNASAQTAGVAVGDRASAAQGGVALGVGAAAVQGNSGVAIGPVALSSGNTSIAVGRQSAASGDYSMALGNVAYAKGESGIAMGHSALADGYRSIAIGASDSRAAGNDGVSNGANYNPATQTRASGANSVSLGAGAVTGVDDSIALGSNSVGAANAAGPAKFSGDAIASTGAVSVGSAGSERQIKNVAGGTAATDAVNVNQLTAVSDRAVKYDTNADGSVNYNSVTLNPGGSPSKLANVAAGDVSSTSTDAVNGAQLNQTNQTVNNLGDSTASAMGGGASYDPATGKVTSPTYNIAGGRQTTISDAINALNEGWNVTTSGNASGTSVAAIRPGATMTVDGGKNIALTQNGSTITVATSDTPTFTSVGIDNGGPVLSGSGLNMAGQKITSVAPGDVSPTSTDAVNGAQLSDTNQKLRQASEQAVKYDTNPDGSINYNSVTMNPGGTATKVTNVAAGDVSANSTDAVNGSQLYDTNQNVTRLGDTLNHIAGDTSQSYTDRNGTGIRYARTNEAGLAQTDAFAQAPGSTAVGYSATASADNALALGREATASHAGSVALGANSIADGSTLGNAAYNPGTGPLAGTNPVGEVSIGSGGAERRITNVAAGSVDTDAVNVSQLKSVETSVGNVSDRAVKYDGSPGDPKTQITLDGPASTDGGKTGGTKITNVAQGDVSANSTDAVNGSQLNETNGNVTKLGDTLNHIAGDTSQSYTDQNGTGIRYVRTNEAGLAQTDAFAQAPGSTAVGYAATASADDALALGRQATASHGGSVALGANAIADGATLGNAAYNPGTGTLAGTNPVGELSIGSSGAARRITNVAAGELSATSTDAVNGSQLYETNRNVTRLGDQVDTIANGGGIKYFHANGGTAPLPDSQANGVGSAAMGPAATASGVDSVAVGNGAVAGKDGDVALGAGSVADRGAEQYAGKYSGAQNSTAGTVSVGAPGAERTVSNVADGREATDAVNVRQLDGAVKEAKDYTDQQVQKMAGDVVNVGDDVRKLGDRMTNVEGDVTRVKNGAGGMFQVSQDQTPVAPAASGSNAVAGGAGAVASGANSTALGNQASATGSNSTAIGNGAKASGSNSVALGAGSDGSRDNAVSMGATGRERQIVNVAPGTAGTDAVNVNQLRAMEHGLGSQIAGVRSDMQSLDHRLTAGVAAAMAMASLPQAYLPGKSMVALGGGAWRGESGVALGLSTVSDNGNWVLKGSASSTSRGDLGASVGVGYQW